MKKAIIFLGLLIILSSFVSAIIYTTDSRITDLYFLMNQTVILLAIIIVLGN